MISFPQANHIPSTSLSPTSNPSTSSKTELLETFLNFDPKPIEFLEEISPELTPDPNRSYGTVVETCVGGGQKIDNFYVKDTSSSGIDLNEYLQKPLPFDYSNKEEPLVLIYHTHTTEAFMSGFTGYYYHDSPTRSTNENMNVTAVGRAIKASLESHGISVIHDTTIHDASYDGAYGRSLKTIREYLEKYPSIKITIDVHRDAMADDSGTKYKPTVTINGKKSAQVMIIAGSDPTGVLEFVNWKDNLIFDLKLQQKASEMYPSLMRPLMYCQRIYNMDVTNASLIFEVGTEVNTMSEAKYAGELMGNVMAEVLK